MTDLIVRHPEEGTEVVTERRTERTLRILQIFKETNLGKAHKGLAKTALEAGVDVYKLAPGQFVMFVNRQVTGFKMFAANNIIIHHVDPNHRRLDERALRYVPDTFRTHGKFDYNVALEKVVKEIVTKNKKMSKAKIGIKPGNKGETNGTTEA